LDDQELKKQHRTEAEVTAILKERFSFTVIPVTTKEQRLLLESRIISTIAKCRDCGPSAAWFGLQSPKEKIRTSGLWLVNELDKKSVEERDLCMLREICRD
jgi:hypothetical protein